MLSALLIGSLALIINMVIQVMAVVVIVRYFVARGATGRLHSRLGTDMYVLGVVIIVLFAGHLMQFATWGTLFLYLGEFKDFQTAFYHSTVNFTSLGYGDLVMSEKWRLLGALEAANGVLMFGLSAGSILSVMNLLISQNKMVIEARKKRSSLSGP